MGMQTTVICAALTGLGLTPACLAGQSASRAALTVRVFNYAEVPNATLKIAESDASRIYRDADVELLWVECPVSTDKVEHSRACEEFHDAHGFSVNIISESMASRISCPPGSLGFALISDAYVFYHRIDEMASLGGLSEARLLGNVLAHELGHLVLGQSSHTARGLMKGTLCEKDLEQVAQGRNLFSARQAQQLRDRLKDRR